MSAGRELRAGADQLPGLSRTLCTEKEEMAPGFNLVKVQPWIQAGFGAQTPGSWRAASQDYCDMIFFFPSQGFAFWLVLDVSKTTDGWTIFSMFGHSSVS